MTDPTAEELAEAIQHVDGTGRYDIDLAELDRVLDAARAHLARLRAPAAGAPSEAVARAREGMDLIDGVGRMPGDGKTEAQSREDHHRGSFIVRAALDEIEAFIKAVSPLERTIAELESRLDEANRELELYHPDRNGGRR